MLRVRLFCRKHACQERDALLSRPGRDRLGELGLRRGRGQGLLPHFAMTKFQKWLLFWFDVVPVADCTAHCDLNYETGKRHGRQELANELGLVEPPQVPPLVIRMTVH